MIFLKQFLTDTLILALESFEREHYLRGDLLHFFGKFTRAYQNDTGKYILTGELESNDDEFSRLRDYCHLWDCWCCGGKTVIEVNQQERTKHCFVTLSCIPETDKLGCKEYIAGHCTRKQRKKPCIRRKNKEDATLQTRKIWKIVSMILKTLKKHDIHIFLFYKELRTAVGTFFEYCAKVRTFVLPDGTLFAFKTRTNLFHYYLRARNKFKYLYILYQIFVTVLSGLTGINLAKYIRSRKYRGL